MAPSQADAKIVIGIDFGTTYSGVAWTWAKAENTEIITSWEATAYSNSDNEKVPTVIHFGKSRGDAITWGYATDPDEEPLKWFKLLLIDERDLPEDVRKSTQLRDARAYLKKANKTTVEVIGLYLRHLWNHTINIITTAIGKAIVNYSQHHVVITLPAIWPEYAKARMREATQTAGIIQKRLGDETTLSFVSEPEAAALATLSGLTTRPDIEEGDSFVVVDCGGGTVDIISYQVMNTNPMTVRECVKGQGGLCGSIFVDDAFTQLLRSKMGPVAWNKMTLDSRQRILNDNWEYGIKKQFHGQERTWTIQYPFECIDSTQRNTLTSPPKVDLSSEDIRGVFQPVMDKIFSLVDGQIKSATRNNGNSPKFIILVGGFGRCKYLFENLKSRTTIEILQSRGTGPWTAICRGAVIHALTTQNLHSTLEVHIASRVSRASYGLSYQTDWNPRKYLAVDRVWCEIRQEWRAYNQMKWFLKEGEDLNGKVPVRHAYHQYYEHPPSSISSSIYMTRESPPSSRKDASVFKFCDIKWETDIDFARLPTYKNTLGKVYATLNWETEMTSSSGSVDFAIYHEGKRVGSKNVSVDFHDHYGFADAA